MKPGITYGATDEIGYHAVENRVMVADRDGDHLHRPIVERKISARLRDRFAQMPYRALRSNVRKVRSQEATFSADAMTRGAAVLLVDQHACGGVADWVADTFAELARG